MRMVVLVVAAVVVTLSVGAADAGAAMRVVDIPGVSGRSVEMVAAARLDDGGAIVVGTLTPRSPARARPRIVVVRLRHSGLVDTSFGSAGVVTVQLARGRGRAGSRATSVAVDPKTGRSWIGASVGAKATGAVLGLHGHGRLLTHFGRNAVVRFDGDETAPSAIAYDGRRLAVAATRRPCRGCQVLLLDPFSGARRGQPQALAPVPEGNAGRCAGAVLGSVALVANRLVLGGSGGPACPTRLVVRSASLGPVADVDPGELPVRTVVTSAGGTLDLCAGLEHEGAVRLVRVAAGAAVPKPAWTPVAGRLVAVVPLGARACGALLRREGKPARVVQASIGDSKASVTEVPRALDAGAMYRCKQHVLVVGTRRRGGVARASVAVTSIVRR